MLLHCYPLQLQADFGLFYNGFSNWGRSLCLGDVLVEIVTGIETISSDGSKITFIRGFLRGLSNSCSVWVTDDGLGQIFWRTFDLYVFHAWYHSGR